MPKTSVRTTRSKRLVLDRDRLGGAADGAVALTSALVLVGEAQERLDGGLDRVEVAVLDVGGVAGQREDAVDVRRAAQEHQPAAELPCARAGVDDGVHAGAVHELELAHVEDDEPRLRVGIAQRLLQLRRRVDVQLAREVHPRGVEAAIGPRAVEGGRRALARPAIESGETCGRGMVDLRGSVDLRSQIVLPAAGGPTSRWMPSNASGTPRVKAD